MGTATVAKMNGQAVGRSGAGALAGASPAAASLAGASFRQMPLSFLKNGESGTIAKVRGKDGLHHHLETLGFVEGARVTVMSEAAGDLIVEVKGTQVALSKRIASLIIASPAG